MWVIKDGNMKMAATRDNINYQNIKSQLVATFIVCSVMGLVLLAPFRAVAMVEAIENYLKGDYTTAITTLLPYRDSGVPLAQHLMGVMYRDGKGVQKDYREAVKWFQRSGNRGLAASLFALGQLHKKGLGVKRNPKRGNDLIRRAAAAGYPKAIEPVLRASVKSVSKEIWIFVANPKLSKSIATVPNVDPKPLSSSNQRAHHPSPNVSSQPFGLNVSVQTGLYQNKNGTEKIVKPNNIYAQIGAFKSETRAITLKNKLETNFRSSSYAVKMKVHQGTLPIGSSRANIPQKPVYKVRAIGFDNLKKAREFCTEVSRKQKVKCFPGLAESITSPVTSSSPLPTRPR